ncbi:MarR family winged helix-turn-helix transcriptional regulator [Pinirhizobacter sp.]|jgi:DNA-binding MarR family transcriptional regulator|uniref:MarR family winged helix-turn-helix transcriptional regulator n=1 Tax=Pinirhizobacter sp. TaxID=2950432 RepID=UPI002F3EB602
MSNNPRDTTRAQAMASELRFAIGQLSRRMREQGLTTDELTWPQVAVLTRIERDGPAGVSDLARAEGVRPQSMGATVALLQDAGLVIGQPDPADGRRTLLNLTPACRKLLTDSRARRADWLFRSIQAQFTPADYETIEQATAILKRLAGGS